MRFQVTVVFLAAIRAYGEPSSSLTSVMIPDDNCVLPNGFEYELCGTGDEKQCCSPEQACVSAQPKNATEQFVCSEERKLAGSKAIRIVVLPMLLTIGSLTVITYMLLRWGRKDCVTWLLVAQVVLSLFLFFSPFWPLGFYSVFLAFLVGHAWKSNDLVWWVYRAAMVLQVFQIIAIFGPFETFHVPFSALSYNTAAQLENAAATLTTDGTACSSYYGDYFTFLPIELSAEGANPNQKTFGYCVEGWLGLVQVVLTLLALLQAGVLFRTAQRFAANEPGNVPKDVPKDVPTDVPLTNEPKPDEAKV